MYLHTDVKGNMPGRKGSESQGSSSSNQAGENLVSTIIDRSLHAAWWLVVVGWTQVITRRSRTSIS